MYTHIITYKTIKDAIRIAFKDDIYIMQFFDPNVQVNSIDEVVANVCEKIAEYANDERVTMQGIYSGNELIGYFVYRNKLLISFSLNVKYRTRNNLKDFYKIIKKEMKGSFSCILWSKNLRAVKWLEKMGGKIIHLDPVLTQLSCQ